MNETRIDPQLTDVLQADALLTIAKQNVPATSSQSRAFSGAAFSVPIVPTSFFGIVLGLVGIGNAWRLAHAIWRLPAAVGESLMVAATAVWAILVGLYVAKWIYARDAAVREAEDPIQCCFIGLAGVATSLIAVAALPHSRPVANILFVVGALFTLGFAVWRTGRLWQGGRDDGATTPVLYLPTVAGAFVTSIAASALGFLDIAQLAFGAGLLSWLAIESVLLHRLYTAPSLPEPLRPTLGIQLAPPAVGTLAYLSLSTGAPGLAAHVLFGYGLLQALVLLRMLPWIARQPFAPSYWAFSFGATALAATALRLAERGDSGLAVQMALSLFLAANIVIAILVVGTFRLILARRLLPLAAAKPVPSPAAAV